MLPCRQHRWFFSLRARTVTTYFARRASKRARTHTTYAFAQHKQHTRTHAHTRARTHARARARGYEFGGSKVLIVNL